MAPEPGSSAPVVICHGRGTEYPFRPLIAHLRERGLPCVELNMADPAWPESLKDIGSLRRRVLITAHHPYLDRLSPRPGDGIRPHIACLADAIDLIEPDRIFYLPHDLAEPIKEWEIGALSSVDIALMPSARYWYLERVTHVEVVGWIGTLSADDTVDVPAGAVAFLPSETYLYLRDADTRRFTEAFRPILEQRPIVKFPVSPGTERLVEVAEQFGCTVLSEQTPAFAVIAAAEVVVSNGFSSIVAEAAVAGTTTFCVLDGLHDERAQREFGACEGVVVGTAGEIADRIAHGSTGESTAHRGGHDLKFDLERVVTLLMG